MEAEEGAHVAKKVDLEVEGEEKERKIAFVRGGAVGAVERGVTRTGVELDVVVVERDAESGRSIQSSLSLQLPMLM